MKRTIAAALAAAYLAGIGTLASTPPTMRNPPRRYPRGASAASRWPATGSSGFAAEHDPASGDLYLRPTAPGGRAGADRGPVTLFIGTERGFTYRLALRPRTGVRLRS